MNNIRFTVNGISCFLLIVLFSRCHKNGHRASSQNDSSCLVATVYDVINGNTTNTTFDYDDQRRLISWNETFSQPVSASTITGQTFRYGTGYVIYTMIYGTALSSTFDSLVLNSDSSVSEHYADLSFNSSSPNTAEVLWKYTYSNNGEVLQRTHSYIHQPGTPLQTTYFTWSNGDLISTTDGNTYTYDTTRKVVLGDSWVVGMLSEYGNVAHTIRNTHMQISNGTAHYSYIYDASGKVISYGNTATSLITYTCP